MTQLDLLDPPAPEPDRNDAATNRQHSYGPKWLPDSLKFLEKRLQLPKHQRRIGNGDHATIRRQATHFPPAFWRLYLARNDDCHRAIFRPSAADDAEVEHAWALVMQGMALMDELAHRRGQAFGTALAGRERSDAEYAEMRFVRMLRATGSDLEREVRAACTWLKQRGRAVDWTDPACLILSNVKEFGIDRDEVTRRIARDYFVTLDRKSPRKS